MKTLLVRESLNFERGAGEPLERLRIGVSEKNLLFKILGIHPKSKEVDAGWPYSTWHDIVDFIENPKTLIKIRTPKLLVIYGDKIGISNIAWALRVKSPDQKFIDPNKEKISRVIAPEESDIMKIYFFKSITELYGGAKDYV